MDRRKRLANIRAIADELFSACDESQITEKYGTDGIRLLEKRLLEDVKAIQQPSK